MYANVIEELSNRINSYVDMDIQEISSKHTTNQLDSDSDTTIPYS
jgi:hypothetical protein